ncbi:MAG: hypothetical protein EPO02_02475 [Nitrospirae bacterium]|nr:MAG: hypothetical protein EPO02_02475 [Nitrospirota bacterium]
MESPLGSVKQRAVALREVGIVPLPLEDLSRFVVVLKDFSDPEKNFQIEARQLAPLEVLQAFDGLYPNNADIVTKLNTVMQCMVSGQIYAVSQVNFWARAHPSRKHVFIYPNVHGMLAFDLASNVSLLVVPMDTFFQGIATVARIFRKVMRAITATLTRKGTLAVTEPPDLQNVSASRVVFVTHKGLNYGDLFQKTLFYSDRIDSELHQENLLHFDYSDTPSPSKKIKWVCLGRQPQSFWLTLYYSLVAIGRGIVRVRRIQHIIGLLILARVYVRFKFYTKRLQAYPDLKVALIDYEVLCPKPLLLAFEAKNIKTVAVQERFFMPSFARVGTVLNTYLCASEYAAEVMRKSLTYSVDRYLPVGQYRSDNLIKARQSPPPRILEAPKAQGRKIIIALGFHTYLDWHDTQQEPDLNWKAHRHFLDEMIRLSQDIFNTFIVLRYKNVDWLSLPIFAEVVQQIESMENITISIDYERPFISYDLCAHSHLVIAKYTSLGNECMSVGIPVLFHDYTHNTKQVVANAFDSNPARIMCFNYQELLERARVVLSGDSHAMTPDYEYLKNVVYGGLGDGKVHKRIQAYIDSLLV